MDSSPPGPSVHRDSLGKNTGLGPHDLLVPLAAAAAAAKSLQLCPTLCDPMDCSLPGFSVHGILQARTLEWVAISFSSAGKWKVKVKSLSHVWLLATPWTAAYQALPSMGFSGQQYWSGVPLPSPKFLYYKTITGCPWENLLKKNYSHIQVTVILLDGIPSLGQLIMPALTLAINLSFFSITQAQSEQQEKFQQRKKKSPIIMGWIYIYNTRLW